MKKIYLTLMVSFVLMASLGLVSAEVNAITPSTNDLNRDNGWAHVNEVGVDIGEVTLEFVQPRNFYACFEYRSDGDTSQMIDSTNYNPAVTDGLYPFFCLIDGAQNETIFANEYVEVRMVFGAETDERFDWTRFDVLTIPTKAEVLIENGVPEKGISIAPGLQKERPNENFAKKK